MKVKGQDILRWPYASIEDFKSRPALSGIPFVGPWANRLDEQAFYANGKRYAFDMDLGNVRGAIPIHGFLSTTDQWQVVEAKADGKSAWVTSKLEFFKQPMWMKQFPFAHTIEVTHRLQDGVLQVSTTIVNMSAEPMPVAVGFHPYYKLTDSKREEWTISVGAQKHWILSPTKIPTGETEPIEKFFRNPQSCRSEGLQSRRRIQRLEPRCAGSRAHDRERKTSATRGHAWPRLAFDRDLVARPGSHGARRPSRPE